MSTWIEIKKQEDVDYDMIQDTVDIFISNDQFGNNYVSVPVEYIINVLKNYDKI